jgi:succinyl-CoA synthetase beta subunit
MRLHEYQAKRILHQYGVPVPPGEVAISVDQVHRIADRLGRRVVLKAQVLTGGRGQAGGILLANDADEARHLADEMLGMPIGG